MQTATPSLTRVISCRHSRKVSCETLTQITIEPHREGASFYYSDEEKDRRKEGSSSGDGEVSDLDSTNSGHSSLASQYLQQVRELERRTGKLDHPMSYGDGKAPRHKFLACLLSKVPHMPAARRAKEVDRLRKHLRAYPSAIHGTGGVLPHSGPILLHIGSQSSHYSSTKASTSLRASASILPRNAVGGKMNPSEPSSPKVTCLGRVKNKQKHIGKCSSATSEVQHDVSCTLMQKRGEKKKNADAEVVEYASKKTSRMGSGNAIVVDHSGKLSNRFNPQNPVGKGTVPSEYVANEERKSWSLRESTRQEGNAMFYQNPKKLQANRATALASLSLEAEFSIDLSRFGQEQSHEVVEGNDTSQRFEQEDKEGRVPAPPRNALLLIRNRKVMDDAEVSALSASIHVHGTSLLGALGDTRMDKIVGTQISASSSTQESDQVLSRLRPESGMKKPITVADMLLPMSLALTSEMECTSSCASQSERFERKFSLQTEYCRQASLPKGPSETRLWQRRAIEKPCTLKIRKPVIRGQINRRAAIWVNKE